MTPTDENVAVNLLQAVGIVEAPLPQPSEGAEQLVLVVVVSRQRAGCGEDLHRLSISLGPRRGSQ